MRALTVALLAAAVSLPVQAQDALTVADYARAEQRLSQHTAPLVLGATVRPQWLDGERFWYVNDVQGGHELVLVDASSPRRARAFDHDRLAGALSTTSGLSFGALELPLQGADFDGGALTLRAGEGRYRCDTRAYVCAAAEEDAGPGRSEVVSPDGTMAAFTRDHDLWVRNVETGAETRLTRDGEEDFGYATNNAGWVRGTRPVLRWSPDSRKIATFKHDARGVGMMHLVRTEVGHQDLDSWRYPLPEDSVIFRVHRVFIDLDRPEGERVVPFRMEPDQHRTTCSDHIVCNGTYGDVEWGPDSRWFAFVSSSRDHKDATLRVADSRTGQVRDVLHEREETFFESGYGGPNWRFLPESGEVVWFSQRDDWGHLYLYDLDSGALKRQITRGAWNVLEVVDVDEGRRELLVLGNEREDGDPYFQYLYRVSLDGGEPVLLTPDSANHTVSLSPDGRYFVDQWSTPVDPPVTAVRDRSGREVIRLQEADISRLLASGWTPPVPFSVKARDGVTDLYGLMFTPSLLDRTQRYPIINYIYPGPQAGSVGSRSFRSSWRDLQALAELGFVVVALDAMGTPMRSKTFHEAYYGNMGDNGLPDQVAGMRQLAERYAFIDLDRAGIYGHSGGGFASTAAMFSYPDFFKVAVSQAGNHDNRNYEDDWGEKWQGLLEEYVDGTTNYDNQANQLKAANLQGKLLLAHGTLDDNVPPVNTLLVVDALIAANKDFDLIMFPNRRHGFGNEPYMMRRRWDYFVRHLAGKEPPAYRIGGDTRPIG